MTASVPRALRLLGPALGLALAGCSSSGGHAATSSSSTPAPGSVTAAGGAGSPAPAPVAGTIAGQPFAPRAAAVRHTSLLGWVLYLLPAEARCGEPTPLGAITPSVVVEVAPRGGGAPAPGTVDPGAVELLQADFSAPGGEVGARASTGITLELATVETARGGHWRGRLRVAPFERGGRRYAYDGRFTATVC